MVDFQSRKRRTRDRDDETDDETTTRSPDEESAAASDDGGGADTEAGVAVVTVSDGHSDGDDPVGEAIIEALANHTVVTRKRLNSDHDSVRQTVDALVGRGDVDAVVIAGGTGVGPRDVTVEAVYPLFETALPGFGELFRRQYYETVGTDVIESRATAGIADGVPVFCLPGEVDGARLGTSEIVTEQVGRLGDSGESE
ncbi:molybdopterin-binding protein [Halobacteriales archaeon QS_4_62_28]|nr:MAG: molybdopterin-binding protein [Halobacteriales archaeon QS_4_62_28]